MLLSKSAVFCDHEKFIKDEKTNGLLSSLGIKTFQNKIPLLDTLLF